MYLSAESSRGEGEFIGTARQIRERNRHLGRPLGRRAVRSTFPLNGLEADVAVILEPDRMSAQHLCVASTRGARRVVVCSPTPLLTRRGPLANAHSMKGEKMIAFWRVQKVEFDAKQPTFAHYCRPFLSRRLAASI